MRVESARSVQTGIATGLAYLLLLGVMFVGLFALPYLVVRIV